MTIRVSMTIGAFALAASAAFAQSDYPSQTIEINVGFAAGGPVDLATRAIAPFIEKHLDGTVAVINRPGAAGTVAAIETANAEPDGYTIMMLSYPALVTALYGVEEPPYTIDGLEFLGNVTSDPHNLFVNADSPYQTLDDFLAAAREAPGELNVNAAGVGGAAHLALLVFESESGVDLNYVPADGGAGTLTQVLGGHVDAGISTLSTLVPYVEENQMRLLATFSAERNPQLPDAPTATEQGVNVEWGALRGFAAPAGLPEDVKTALTEAIDAAMHDPEFLALAESQAIPLQYMTGEEFRAAVEADVESLDELWETSPWVVE